MTLLLTASPTTPDDQEIDLMDQLRPIVPWAMSIAFHIGLLMILVFFVRQLATLPDLPTVAVPGLKNNPEPPMELKIGGRPEEKVTDLAAITATQAPVVVPELQEAPPSILPNPNPNPNPEIGSPGGGGNGLVTFLGPPQPANRIVYIVDRSGSMFRNFDSVKAHLNASIRNLTIEQNFCVLYFSDDAPRELAIDGQAGWHIARAYNRDKAVAWSAGIFAGSRGGRTDPISALRRAFSLPGPKPDIIYLLTDGGFSNEKEVLSLLGELNRERKVRICTISVIDDEGAEVLGKIARDHRGVYRHVTEEGLAN